MNKILEKIVIKVLSISLIKRGLDRAYYIYNKLRIKTGFNLFDGKQGLDMMDLRHYLPDTKERIKRLRRVINKRPVAIILPGSSVRELEARITELKDCDICYFGMNDFQVIEKYILQKINRNLSVLMDSAYPNIRINYIIDFLERSGNNIFISERSSFSPERTTDDNMFISKKPFFSSEKMSKDFDFDKFARKYDKKLLFFITVCALSSIIIKNGSVFLRESPSIKYPLHFLRQSSISVLLSLAIIGQASQVILFGADGGRVNSRELYLRESSVPENRILSFGKKLMIDAKIFNKTMPLMLKKIYKIYNLKPIDIVNCSEKSYYTPFRKLSYNETFNLLKHGKPKE